MQAVKVIALTTENDNHTLRRAPERDESYWAALLDEVESLAAEQLKAVAPTGEQPAQATPTDATGAWAEARQALADELVFEIYGIGCNKGGILVEWRGLGGFVPASQLVDFPNLHVESERVHELQRRQHHKLRLRIIEVDASKNRLIFSERAAQVAARERRNLWEEIAPGDIRTGMVTNMANFGAFVDLGGVEGLIHLSELSWSRINHPSDVVQPGQEVTTRVLDVDRTGGRIALSLKRMRRDPWSGISRRYAPGQLVTGTVRSVAPFGIFVTLEEQLEGLIHVSELIDREAARPRDVVSKGDVVTVRVLSVDERGRKLALTLRNVQERANGDEPPADS